MNELGRIVVASGDANTARGFSSNDEKINRRIRKGRRVQEVLRFQNACKLDLLEQLLCVLAVAQLDNLDVPDVVPFVERYVQLLRENHADYLQTLRRAKLVQAEDASEVWIKVATEVATELKPEKPEEPADSKAERSSRARPWWKIW